MTLNVKRKALEVNINLMCDIAVVNNSRAKLDALEACSVVTTYKNCRTQLLI